MVFLRGLPDPNTQYPLSEVESDPEGHGSSTTTLREAFGKKPVSGEPKHVHEAVSVNPPILSCADPNRAASPSSNA